MCKVVGFTSFFSQAHQSFDAAWVVFKAGHSDALKACEKGMGLDYL